MFEIPDHVRGLCDDVRAFIDDRVIPVEPVLFAGGAEADAVVRELQAVAKDAGLWALGHPRELGGGGLDLLDYVYVNEIQGRSEFGQVALGTLSLQDSLMLHRHATGTIRDRYLTGLVDGSLRPSFAMTEPAVSSSDPTQLTATARLDGDEWIVDAHKWFITGAAEAAFTAVMCRTEADADDPHRVFSLIVVPTDAPGYRIVRDLPVLGLHHGHYEISLEGVRVPVDHLVGERGRGFHVAQDRLGPGRIFHGMRWLGQAQRALELMIDRLNSRQAFGTPLADKQLMQEHVFESYVSIHACRLMTLDAAQRMDAGSSARTEIGALKVVGARMLNDVVDRALQVYGAAGLTEDWPLSAMYRTARFARIYDGPDEVHISSIARRLLRSRPQTRR